MALFTDQAGNTITLHNSARRIISLVPSQTELLYDLGLDEEVIGISKFCVRPAHWFNSKTRIGGTKSVKTALVKELKPDLVIANREENVKKQVDELAKDFPVWISDINNLQSALQMITALGEITGKETASKDINDHIRDNFLKLRPLSSQLRTAYLIWRNPYMSIGGDTFISDMLNHCGFKNIFENQQRYPEVTVEQIRDANCELLLLSSEPFPFKEKHMEALQKQLPSTKIVLADGEMFSWYGSRLVKAPAYFSSLIQSF
jgi:ABC-type Fe3+-hydroxamate transport system substrate-binding protein